MRAAESLLARLKAGTSHVEVVEYPGMPGTQVGVRPLTGQDVIDAKLAAVAILPKDPPMHTAATIRLDEAVEHEEAYQLLFRSLVDPESHRPFAATVGECRRLVTLDELTELYTHIARLSGTEELAQLDDARVDELGKAGACETTSSGDSASSPSATSASPHASAPTASSSGSSSASPASSTSDEQNNPSPTHRQVTGEMEPG